MRGIIDFFHNRCHNVYEIRYLQIYKHSIKISSISKNYSVLAICNLHVTTGHCAMRIILRTCRPRQGLKMILTFVVYLRMLPGANGIGFSQSIK